MIEEFQDYLMRVHGVLPNMAGEIHDAAYDADEQGLRMLDFADGPTPGQMIAWYHEWQRSVGELCSKTN